MPTTKIDTFDKIRHALMLFEFIQLDEELMTMEQIKFVFSPVASILNPKFIRMVMNRRVAKLLLNLEGKLCLLVANFEKTIRAFHINPRKVIELLKSFSATKAVCKKMYGDRISGIPADPIHILKQKGVKTVRILEFLQKHPNDVRLPKFSLFFPARVDRKTKLSTLENQFAKFINNERKRPVIGLYNEQDKIDYDCYIVKEQDDPILQKAEETNATVILFGQKPEKYSLEFVMLIEENYLPESPANTVVKNLLHGYLSQYNNNELLTEKFVCSEYSKKGIRIEQFMGNIQMDKIIKQFKKIYFDIKLALTSLAMKLLNNADHVFVRDQQQYVSLKNATERKTV